MSVAIPRIYRLPDVYLVEWTRKCGRAVAIETCIVTPGFSVLQMFVTVKFYCIQIYLLKLEGKHSTTVRMQNFLQAYLTLKFKGINLYLLQFRGIY